jgi:hypothetical protein
MLQELPSAVQYNIHISHQIAVCIQHYYTLISHSAELSHVWLRFDFVGIVALTLGDFVLGIYMVFYCEPTSQKGYWTIEVGIHFYEIVCLTLLIKNLGISRF